MEDLKLKRVMFCLRLLCVATMVVSGVLASMVFYAPKTVDRWGELLISRYEQNLSGEFANLYILYEQQNPLSEKGRKKILSLLDKIRKHDRFATQKREFLTQISLHYRQNGNYQEALRWVAVWEAFDERDLFAKMERAQIYLAIPDKHEDGRSLARQLYETAPEVPEIKDLYMLSQLKG